MSVPFPAVLERLDVNAEDPCPRSASAVPAHLRGPHFAVQARIELARVQLALSDLAGARTPLREIDELLRRRPDLGTLTGEARALRTRLSEERGPSVPGPSALTAAELRILPLLATHLSYPEIATELFLSKHTIKSQAHTRCTASWEPPHAARQSPGLAH